MQRSAITTPAEFAAIRNRWDDLYRADGAAQVFLSGPWLEAYLAGAPYPWMILVLREDDRLVAALPVSVRAAPHPKLPIARELTFAAAPIADYHGMLCRAGREGEAASAFAEMLMALPWERARFPDVSDPRFAAVLEQLDGNGVHVRETGTATCYRTALPHDFESFLARLGKGTRRATLRGQKQIAEQMPHARITRATDADVEAHAEAVVRVNHVRWGGASVRAKRYRGLLIDAYATGCARLHVAWDGDRPMAGSASFVDAVASTYGMWLLGHDPAYGNVSPGRAILAATLREACDEGFAVYDFMRGEEDYKKPYATDQRVNRSYAVSRSGVRAAALRAAQPLYELARARVAPMSARPGRA